MHSQAESLLILKTITFDHFGILKWGLGDSAQRKLETSHHILDTSGFCLQLRRSDAPAQNDTVHNTNSSVYTARTEVCMQ